MHSSRRVTVVRPTVEGGRRALYLDVWRAAALVRVVVYHVFGWAWLTVLFPAMGLMFALAGSLMAGSLDRSDPSTAVRRRLRRLLLPFWVFGAVTVTLSAVTGWGAKPQDVLGWGELVWWLLPLRTPPVGSQAWAWAHQVVLWYIVTYLWLVLLSPVLLRLLRRRPWPTLAVSIAVPVLFRLDVVTVGGYFHDQGLNVATYAGCWLIGFAHHDGLLRRVPGRVYAVVVAALAVSGGGWILVEGAAHGTFDINRVLGGNTLYSAAFAATVLRFRPSMAALTRLRPVYRAVCVLNARAVTVYLWHLPAGVVASMALAAVPVHGWPVRVLVPLAAVAVLTAGTVLAVGWVEDVAARRAVTLVPPASPPIVRSHGAAGGRGADPSAAVTGVVITVLTAVAIWFTPASTTPSGNRQPGAEAVRYLADLVLITGPTDAPVPYDSIGGAITVDGVTYPHAIVTTTPSRLRVLPPAGCDRLRAVITVMPGAADPEVGFTVAADTGPVFAAGPQRGADPGETVDVGITGATFLDLASHAPVPATTVWADAHLVCRP
jgi:hypothetical protein